MPPAHPRHATNKQLAIQDQESLSRGANLFKFSSILFFCFVASSYIYIYIYFVFPPSDDDDADDSLQ